jgi:CDK-activating kinase assembly factor MAT1
LRISVLSSLNNLTVAFNLVNGTDLKETEAKVAAYEAANRSSIVANAARSSAEQAALTKQEELVRQQREQARLAALKEEAAEKYERERQKTDLIRDLASSEGSAEKILARNKAAALKRSSARRQNDEIRMSGASTLTFGMGVGSMEDTEEDDGQPFDPLDGQGEESSLYKVRQSYEDT